jgi:hypothetical protein
VTAAGDARDGQIAMRDGDGSSASAAHPEIWRDGLLAGLDPTHLAARFHTPLYVYDLDAVAERARILRAALPTRFDIAYAVKANPSLAVIARLAAEGIGADVPSEGELEAARRAGVPSGSVVVTGPGKSDALIGSAVSPGVRAVVVESPLQLDRVEEAARTIGVRAPARSHARRPQPPPAPGRLWIRHLGAPGSRVPRGPQDHPRGLHGPVVHHLGRGGSARGVPGAAAR